MSTEPTLRCLVVDDEPLAAVLICSYVNRTPFLELAGQADSAEAALEILRDDNELDLIFLDIHMPGLSGLELARLVPESTRIIFTTAYSEHAIAGYKVRAIDYLLKPVSYEEFLNAALRAQKEMTERAAPAPTTAANGHILVKSEYRLIRIPLADIEYIEGLKDYVKIYVAGESKPVLSLMSMKSIEESLGEQFTRVHRSFIVNLDKVRVIERNCIIMADRAIPVSESYRRRFLGLIGAEE
ncbi:MAG: response regulator transcription factor [Bacteroidales bacterium]|nr:response regulator transcription factor [Bacteroidales bacterium]